MYQATRSLPGFLLLADISFVIWTQWSDPVDVLSPVGGILSVDERASSQHLEMPRL
jgi:hypothetical protein